MNLKEAFRFQNRIQKFIMEVTGILKDDRNITRVTNTYLRSKVMPEADNEVTTDDMPYPEYADKITELVNFAVYLLEQKEKLAYAINKTKQLLPIDMDGEVSLNGHRQDIARLLTHMADLRSSEVLIHNGGTGYRFNADGNQVAYKCPVKKVTTINFDRNKVRRISAELTRKADEMSTELDRCIINYEVDYTVPFDVNESFTSVFERYTNGEL